MRRWWPAFVVVALLALPACFNVDQPPCSYSCGDNGQCPDEYVCLSDGYCHLHGTGVCSYSDAAPAPDLAVATPMDDLSMPGDMAPAPDLMSLPLTPSDASVTVDSSPPSDVDLQ